MGIVSNDLEFFFEFLVGRLLGHGFDLLSFAG
jgi:hypothetical protein